MNVKLFRNQGEQGGGGAPAQAAPSPQPAVAAPSAPAGGASSAPSNSGGESPYERFQSQLAGLSLDAAKNSQPPGNGNKSGASANDPQGEPGDPPPDDQDTTVADDGDSTNTDEKGVQEAWSEDEQKALKEHGLDDMPYHPSARKLVQSNRELRSQFDRVSASNANAITEAETIRQAAYAAAAGDAKALQDTLGIDLKLNQRTPDDQLKEYGEYHGSQLQILQEAITRFEGAGQMDVAQALLDVGNKVLGLWNDKVKVVQNEKEKQEWKNQVLKEVGKAHDPQAKYKELSQAAQTNLAKLTAEDPEAAKYYEAAAEATKPGGALRAIGIDLAKAFGTNLQTARHFIEYGKALHVLKNQTQIINAERQRWEKDAERRKTQGGTRGTSTGGSAGGRAAPNNAVATLAAQMRAFAGK